MRLAPVPLLVIILFSMSGCDRAPTGRSYKEIVISSPAPKKMGSMNDPHAFMRNMPGSNMPGMQVPEGPNGENMQKALDASVTRPPLSWDTPVGWKELKGSGMRLVSFQATDEAGSIECSIVSLAGQAGGLESNAIRWMGQVAIAVPAPADMDKFLSNQKTVKTKDGFSATVIDLTQLQDREDLQTPSMIASIIQLNDMTVFVKMTGSKGAVLSNREKFETLCQSIKLN